MKKIKVAVIGGGNMGKNHVRTYSSIEGVDLVALVDINKDTEKLAKEYNTNFYNDFKEMIDLEKPEAVSIVGPTNLHFPISKFVMEKGIHCLVEKPIASTPAEGEKLVKIARDNKVIFTVGHIERFNPMIQKLKKLVDEKEIGDITSIIVKRVGGFPAVEPKTDVIIDLAVHDIDILNYLLGKSPKKVYSHGSKTLHSKEIDSAEIFLDYGGASGFIQANWITPIKIRTIAITGTKGYVEGNYITQELTYYNHTMEPKNDGFKNFVVTVGEPEKRYITDEPKEPLANELKEFLEAIKNRNSSKLVHPDDAINALDIALKALD